MSIFRNESVQKISPCLPAEKRIKEKNFWCPLLLTGTNEKSALDEVAHKNVIRAKKWLIKMLAVVDFFVRSADDLIPVEIKSGNDQSKSMKELINNDNYPDIKYGIKFISGNIGITDKVKTFPHFCMFLLKRYIEETT